MKNINKTYDWIQTHKSMTPGKLEAFLFIFSLVLGAIAYDLQTNFNLDFSTVGSVCGFFLISSVSYTVIWLIESIVLIIYCKVNYHKTPKEFCEAIEFAERIAKKYENK